MIPRIQPLLLDGILAANILPRHFQFARTPPGSLQMRQLAHFKRGGAMTKLTDVAIFLIGLLAAVYMLPVSKALTFVVVGSLYGFLVWRIFSNAKREKKTRR